MKRDRALETKVGLFVLIGLLVVVIMVFVLGSERHVFDSKEELVTHFENIEGLKIGAPVRLAGVDVGLVEDITFGATPDDPRIRVTLSVRSAVMDRIKADSTATIGSRGLLGDKIIDLSMGTTAAPPIEPGGELKSKSAADFGALMAKAGQVLDNVISVSESAKRLMESFAGSPIEDDAESLIGNLAKLAEDIRKGDGFLHSLVYGDQYQTRVMQTLEDVSASAAALRSAVEHADAMMVQAQKGPGAVHAMLYDPNGAEMVASISRAASELEAILHAARTGDGMIRKMIEGVPDRDPMGDLAEAAHDLREIARRLRAGEGTIGGLLRDPTIYEDLKLTLSEVRRNQALKAVLRFAIEARDDDPTPPPQFSEK